MLVTRYAGLVSDYAGFVSNTTRIILHQLAVGWNLRLHLLDRYAIRRRSRL